VVPSVVAVLVGQRPRVAALAVAAAVAVVVSTNAVGQVAKTVATVAMPRQAMAVLGNISGYAMEMKKALAYVGGMARPTCMSLLATVASAAVTSHLKPPPAKALRARKVPLLRQAH
jgi:hypothetical protein